MQCKRMPLMNIAYKNNLYMQETIYIGRYTKLFSTWSSRYKSDIEQECGYRIFLLQIHENRKCC